MDRDDEKVQKGIDVTEGVDDRFHFLADLLWVGVLHEKALLVRIAKEFPLIRPGKEAIE